MASAYSNSPSVLQARIAELIGKGYTARAAERHARKERKLASPQHKAAMARRIQAATLRFEAVGVFQP